MTGKAPPTATRDDAEIGTDAGTLVLAAREILEIACQVRLALRKN
jgi:hypothetical protein